MDSKKQPWLIIISGPNGAGKTTFHDRVLSENPFFKDALFANSDIEFKRLSQLPENKELIEGLQTKIQEKQNIIRKKLAKGFSVIMNNVGGNLQERISKKNSENVDYWYKQFIQYVHLPEGKEAIVSGVSTRHDLMTKVSSENLHERINMKMGKQNWYPLYKKSINTIEVQYAIEVAPIRRELENVETILQVQAGKNTLAKMYNAFENNRNIMLETTGSGMVVINMIKRAKEIYNYRVYSFHTYLLRPELSIARVQHRVKNGGHDVPVDAILRRYDAGLRLLPRVLSAVDVGIVLDNSGKKPYMPVFALTDGYITDFVQCPEYLKSIRQEMAEKYPQKSVQELLHTETPIELVKMTEQQRENFGQIVMSTLLGQIK